MARLRVRPPLVRTSFSVKVALVLVVAKLLLALILLFGNRVLRTKLLILPLAMRPSLVLLLRMIMTRSGPMHIPRGLIPRTLFFRVLATLVILLMPLMLSMHLLL